MVFPWSKADSKPWRLPNYRYKRGLTNEAALKIVPYFRTKVFAPSSALHDSPGFKYHSSITVNLCEFCKDPLLNNSQGAWLRLVQTILGPSEWKIYLIKACCLTELNSNSLQPSIPRLQTTWETSLIYNKTIAHEVADIYSDICNLKRCMYWERCPSLDVWPSSSGLASHLRVPYTPGIIF